MATVANAPNIDAGWVMYVAEVVDIFPIAGNIKNLLDLFLRYHWNPEDPTKLSPVLRAYHTHFRQKDLIWNVLLIVPGWGTAVGVVIFYMNHCENTTGHTERAEAMIDRGQEQRRWDPGLGRHQGRLEQAERELQDIQDHRARQQEQLREESRRLDEERRVEGIRRESERQEISRRLDQEHQAEMRRLDEERRRIDVDFRRMQNELASKKDQLEAMRRQGVSTEGSASK